MTHLELIFISFLDQSTAYKEIDSLIKKQLTNKVVDLKTSFHHFKKDTLFHQTKDSLLNFNTFSVNSEPTFVRDNEAFQLVYNNPNIEAIKGSSFRIFLSLLLF